MGQDQHRACVPGAMRRAPGRQHPNVVARQAGAQKTILVRLHEVHDLRPHLGLADITHASEVIAQEL